MTSVEKIQSVERQVQEIGNGERLEIECPYCGCQSKIEIEFLCCEELSTLVHAILDHIEHLHRIEAIDRTLEYVDKTQRSALVN
jgi:hypothetical protein